MHFYKRKSKMIDSNFSNTPLPERTPEHGVKKSRGLNVRLIAAILFAVIFVLVVMLFSKVAKLQSSVDELSKRLGESEDYIAAMNTNVDEYPEADGNMLYHDDIYGDFSAEPLEGVPLNTLDWENLELGEDNRYTYYENGEAVSKTGIDVSYHQGDIDWEKVAADGIDFAMIRIGYRGYEKGVMHRDELSESYISGAQAAGIDVGVYFYSQAVSEAEAREEAVYVCELIKDSEIKYPVVFDWELPDDSEARTLGTTTETLNKCAAAFCQEITNRGYTAMLYSNLKMALTKYDMQTLIAYDFWYVEYKNGHNPPSYPYELQMWQYASDGRVDGVDGYVDMNISFVDYAAEYSKHQNADFE